MSIPPIITDPTTMSGADSTASHPGAVARWLPPLGFLVLLVGIWQLWTVWGDVPPWVLPSPSSVVTSGWAVRGPLVGHTITTLVEALVGLALGTIAGLVTAIIVTAWPALQRAVWPLIVTSQTIPVIVLAPLFAVWFGFGLEPKIVMVALITFFPITVSAVAGLGSVDKNQVDLLRSFGATRRQQLRLVRIPSALPSVIAGVRIAAAYAIGDAVVGEYIGGTSGLGIFIDRSKSAYRTDQMLAGVVVIATFSILLFAIVGLIGRRLTPWIQTAHENPTPLKARS